MAGTQGRLRVFREMVKYAQMARTLAMARHAQTTPAITVERPGQTTPTLGRSQAYHIRERRDAARHAQTTPTLGRARYVQATQTLALQPLNHRPRGFLVYLSTSVDLRGCDPLAARGKQTNRYGPLLVADSGRFHGSTRLDAEPLIAPECSGAIVRHGFVVRLSDVGAAATGAPATVRPDVFLKPLLGGLAVGEHLKQLLRRDPHPDRLAWRLPAHATP